MKKIVETIAIIFTLLTITLILLYLNIISLVTSKPLHLEIFFFELSKISKKQVTKAIITNPLDTYIKIFNIKITYYYIFLDPILST